MVSQTGVLLAQICRRAFLIRDNSTELNGFALIIKETVNYSFPAICLQPFAPSRRADGAGLNPTANEYPRSLRRRKQTNYFPLSTNPSW